MNVTTISVGKRIKWTATSATSKAIGIGSSAQCAGQGWQVIVTNATDGTATFTIRGLLPDGTTSVAVDPDGNYEGLTIASAAVGKTYQFTWYGPKVYLTLTSAGGNLGVGNPVTFYVTTISGMDAAEGMGTEYVEAP